MAAWYHTPKGEGLVKVSDYRSLKYIYITPLLSARFTYVAYPKPLVLQIGAKPHCRGHRTCGVRSDV